MKEVDNIYIHDEMLGCILIHGRILKEVNEQIGNVVEDYLKHDIYYHSKITANEDGTFNLGSIYAIKPESIIVGWMDNSKGNKNFITVITNRKVSEQITIYPQSILSVTYEN